MGEVWTCPMFNPDGKLKVGDDARVKMIPENPRFGLTGSGKEDTLAKDDIVRICEIRDDGYVVVRKNKISGSHYGFTVEKSVLMSLGDNRMCSGCAKTYQTPIYYSETKRNTPTTVCNFCLEQLQSIYGPEKKNQMGEILPYL